MVTSVERNLVKAEEANHCTASVPLSVPISDVVHLSLDEI